MNDTTAQAVQALQLPDDAFRAASNEGFNRIARSFAPRFELPKPGVTPLPVEPIFALGMSRVVEPDLGPAVPGTLLLRYQGRRQWEVNLNQNLVFIVVDLQSGALATVNPFQVDKLMLKPAPSGTGPVPSQVNLNAVTTVARRFVLPGVFGDEWPSTNFAVAAIAFDWLSNVALLERRPALTLPPTPPREPSAFVQSLAASAGTPPAGMNLSATGPGAKPVSLRLALPHSAVTLARSTERPDSVAVVGEMLLVRLDHPRPVRVAVVAPAQQQRDLVTAHFSIDLAQRPEANAIQGLCQVYFVSGQTIAGPLAIRL